MAPFDLHVMGAGIHTQRTHILKQTTAIIIIIMINNNNNNGIEGATT